MDPGKLSRKGAQGLIKKILYVQQTLKLFSNEIQLCFTCCLNMLHNILLRLIDRNYNPCSSGEQ